MPIDLSSEDAGVMALLTFRNPTKPPEERPSVRGAERRPPQFHEPLINVAREKHWFKVDALGSYK